MRELTLTIKVPEFTEEALSKGILDACAERILGGRHYEGADEDGEVYSRWEPGIVKEIREQARVHTMQRVDGLVSAQLEQTIADLLDGEFSPVSQWGDAGPPTTLRAIIGAQVQVWLAEKVDERGRKPGYGGKGKPRLDWVIREHVESVMRDELKSTLSQAKAEVKKALNKRVTEQIGKTVLGVLKLEV